MRKALLASVTGTALLGFGAPAMADSLTPSACPGGSCLGFSSSVGIGGTTHINNKVGIITAGGPTSAKADVMFISDTTGSMAGAISAVQSAFSAVVTSLAGSISDLGTGAAQFKDNIDFGSDSYNLDAAISTTPATTNAGIGTWSASGGGDTPEQALYALRRAASDGATGWRSGAKRIIVLTGDAPSHTNLDTVASAAAALNVAPGVTVESLDAGGLNSYGQFSGGSSIYAAGVAGSYTTPFPSSSALAATISALVGSAFATYSDVSLNLIALSGPCSVSLPSDILGSFTRGSTNTFNFGGVSITGLAAGTCSFTIALEADGAILATESDTVHVAPEPASLAVLGAGLLGLGGVIRRRRRA